MAGETLRPYDPPRDEGVEARVQMARSASAWRADTEALLVENGLPIRLAETVESLVDANGVSIRVAVGMLRQLLAHSP